MAQSFEADRIQDIFVHLQQKGFSVYFPGQHQGECTEPYVVVKGATNTQFRQYSSTVQYYDLLCYVPKEHFSTLYPYVDSIKAAMKELVPMIKPAYYDTAPFYDDGIKGHMVSIQYINYRKM